MLSGNVVWGLATSYSLRAPFDGVFGSVTSAMAGLYLIGFAAPAFEAAGCHVGETLDPVRNVPRAFYASAAMDCLFFVAAPIVWLGVLGALSSSSPTDQVFVRAMVELARGLGKQTIAQFVEDEDTLRLITELGVDFAQGYHVGRPAPLSTEPRTRLVASRRA